MQPMFENPNTGVNEDFLYQWDRDVKMFVDIKNATEVEAMFSTDDMSEGRRVSLSYEENGWYGIVPNVLLEKGKPLTVSIAYTDHGRKTIADFKVPVKKQIKPEGYISEENEDVIDTNHLLNQAKEMAADAVDRIRDVMGAIPDDYRELDKKVNRQIVIEETPDQYTKLEILPSEEEDEMVTEQDLKELVYYGPNPRPSRTMIHLKDGETVELMTKEDLDDLLRRVNRLEEYLNLAD